MELLQRIENVDAGALGTLYHLGQDPRLNHEFPVRAKVMGEESADLLRGFFAERRNGAASDVDVKAPPADG